MGEYLWHYPIDINSIDGTKGISYTPTMTVSEQSDATFFHSGITHAQLLTAVKFSPFSVHKVTITHFTNANNLFLNFNLPHLI